MRRAFALLAPVLLAACASTSGPAGSPAPAAGGAPSAAELDAIWRARQDSALMRFTPADVRFMQGMIHHHAQAVEMSRLAPANGASSQVQVLAARIINAQLDEIDTMQDWLRLRGQSAPVLHITDERVMVHADGHAGHVHMPGMLTAEQMAALRAARGGTFDRMFLELMIEHHRGAVHMVHELFATDGAAQDATVFKFASDVQVDQTTEVRRMELMLAELDTHRQ